MTKFKLLVLAGSLAIAGCNSEKSEFHDIESQLMAHSPELKATVESTKSVYEQGIQQIIEGAKTANQEVIAQINSSIEEAQEALKDQQALFDKECTTDELKGGDQCNKIGEGIVTISNAIKGAEIKKTNILGTATTEKDNALAAHKSRYKNNLLKLASQGGVQLEGIEAKAE